MAAAILTACSSSKSTVGVSGYEKHTPSWPKESDTSVLPPQSKRLLSSAHDWLGVPYKYGGNDRKGVDCSGLVVRIYKDALGIALPRTSREQHDQCIPTSKESLIPGDLIFYSTGRKRDEISHVGIYIGDDLMIHASASKGVILSDINGEYYLRRFVSSGKVGQYHAMIDDNRYQLENPPRAVSPQNIPSTIEISITATPPNTGKVQPESATKDPPIAATQQAISQPVKTGQNTAAKLEPVKSSADSQAELSAEEARKAVLNSIKEKKL